MKLIETDYFASTIYENIVPYEYYSKPRKWNLTIEFDLNFEIYIELDSILKCNTYDVILYSI